MSYVARVSIYQTPMRHIHRIQYFYFLYINMQSLLCMSMSRLYHVRVVQHRSLDDLKLKRK